VRYRLIDRGAVAQLPPAIVSPAVSHAIRGLAAVVERGSAEPSEEEPARDRHRLQLGRPRAVAEWCGAPAIGTARRALAAGMTEAGRHPFKPEPSRDRAWVELRMAFPTPSWPSSPWPQQKARSSGVTAHVLPRSRLYLIELLATDHQHGTHPSLCRRTVSDLPYSLLPQQ
jgi:hypothetical protein